MSEPDYPARNYAWSVLAILLLVNIVSFLDRYLLSLAVVDIKREFGVSDTQISLLQGATFSVFYAVIALPFGRLVDRTNRVRLLSLGLAVWSTMTGLTGFAHNYGELMVCRMGLGIGEACLGPVAFSLIADCFAPQVRGRAFGIYGIGNYLGAGASLLLGGLLFHLVSRLAPAIFGLRMVSSWRVAFGVAGLLGWAVLLPLALVREVKRHQDNVAAGTDRMFVQFIRLRLGCFTSVYVTYLLSAFAGYALAAWIPTYYIRVFQMTPAAAGITMGATMMVAGTGGCLVSGWASDRLAKVRPGRFAVPLGWWCLAIPASIGFGLAPGKNLSLIFLALLVFGNALSNSSLPAVLQEIVPNRLRGRATAVHFALAGLIGLTAAPTAVALVTDHILHNPVLIGESISLVLLPASVAGLAVNLLGLRSFAASRTAPS